MPKLNWTANPCRVCKLKRTIGVVYGWGLDCETRWFCWDHVPPEFQSGNLKGRRR